MAVNRVMKSYELGAWTLETETDHVRGRRPSSFAEVRPERPTREEAILGQATIPKSSRANQPGPVLPACYPGPSVSWRCTVDTDTW